MVSAAQMARPLTESSALDEFVVIRSSKYALGLVETFQVGLRPSFDILQKQIRRLERLQYNYAAYAVWQLPPFKKDLMNI